MKQLEAIEILNKILKEINDDNLFLSEDSIFNLEIRKAIAELEALQTKHNEVLAYCEDELQKAIKYEKLVRVQDKTVFTVTKDILTNVLELLKA